MRAISVFSLEAGTSTLGWRARMALRTRVSMSAIGSLVIPALQLFLWLSPARLRDAGDFPVQRQLAEAQPADAELAQKSARPAATPAAVAMLAVVQSRRFGGAGLFQFQIFGSLGGGGHDSFSFSPYCGYGRNGMPICFNRASPSASVRAEVVMEIFIPLVFSTLA